MIDFAGWSRKTLADGIVLYPPGGRATGGIRIRDRVRPLRPVRQLVGESMAAAEGALRDQTLGALERVTTLEGEYGAIVPVQARRRADDRSIARWLGFVFGEEFYAQVDGIIEESDAAPSFAEHVREVVLRTSLGLGEIRRRRFLYTPPRGWQALVRALSSDWIAPAYPRDPGVITVFHAKPVVASPTALFERMLREDLPAGFAGDSAAPVVLRTRNGLAGEIISLAGRYPGSPARWFDLAVLTDPRFLYLVRLDSGQPGLESHRVVHRELVESIVPLPSPAPRREDAGMGHWST
jgi:hypothetical protein